MRVEGRYVLEQPSISMLDGRPSLRVGYSLTKLEWDAPGPDLLVCAQDLATHGYTGTRYAATVDGMAVADYVPTAVPACAPLVRGLSPELHRVTLVKRTEPEVSETRFWRAPNARSAPVGPPRKILIVGDSISCGYGVLCTDPSKHFSGATEDATQTYAAIIAKHFAAQIEVVAYSGRGVWRNRDGTFDGTLPKLFMQALPSKATPTRWPARADAVLVLLGTNDFAKPSVDERAFTAEFVSLLQSIAMDSPTASIFVGLGPMLTDRVRTTDRPLTQARYLLKQAIARSNLTGRIALIEFPPQNESAQAMRGFGCDYHPNLATHEAMAAQWIPTIQAKMGW